MAAWLDVCRFSPTAGGTTDWTYSAAVQGYQSPTAAGVVNGTVYRYRAESADLSQWEVGFGAYNTGTNTLARTTVLFNSAGTTAKISFTVAPQVAIVALKEDLISIEEANAFTATQRAQARTNISAVLKGHLFVLTLSTAGASATFGIAAGEAADSTGVDLMALASAYTKTTGAWAVGTGNGALDTSVIAINTWYHAFIIKRPDTGVVDVLVSLSATAPTLPTNYTLFRRIGSMRTNGSSQWIKFLQLGDEFLWDVIVQDAAAVAVSTTALVQTLSVPTGIQVIANLSFFMNVLASGSTGFYLLTSPDVTDTLPSVTAFDFLTTTSGFANLPSLIRTNTLGQVRVRCSLTTGGTAYFNTKGWIDTRGRLS